MVTIWALDIKFHSRRPSRNRSSDPDLNATVAPARFKLDVLFIGTVINQSPFLPSNPPSTRNLFYKGQMEF